MVNDPALSSTPTLNRPPAPVGDPNGATPPGSRTTGFFSFIDPSFYPQTDFATELALVVASADVHRERDAGMAIDDRVVQFDAAVDQLFRVAAPLTVALTHLRIEQGRVLGRIDLDVCAAQANQLFDLKPRDVDDIGQVLVARLVCALRLLRAVVPAALLRADHRHLARALCDRAHKGPLLAAHAAPPTQLLHDHGPLEHELLAFLVSEWNRPTSLFVETLEGVDKVAEERVPALPAVRHDIDARVFLESNRGDDLPVLLALEVGSAHLSAFPLPAGRHQRRRAK